MTFQKDDTWNEESEISKERAEYKPEDFENGHPPLRYVYNRVRSLH